MQMWKFGDYKSYTSLELLTAVLNIESSKSEIKGSDVSRIYKEEGGLDRIADYCSSDIIATARVYMKLKGLSPIPNSQIHSAPHDPS